MADFVTVPRSLLEDAQQAIRDAERYGAGEWPLLLLQLEQVLADEAGVAIPLEDQPVAVVGSDYTLLWAGGDSVADIAKRHGLRVGSRLYAHPPDGVGVTDHQTFPCDPPMDGSKP